MNQMENKGQHPAFLAWPDRAKFQRVLPKNKFYQYGKVTAKVREVFVRQIEQITLQYAVAPATINLAPRTAVPEIHLLRIELKTPELDFAALRCIDAVWQFPTLFELTFQGRTRVAAAYKRPASGDNDGNKNSNATKWICSNHYATEWFPSDTPRTALPLALDLAGLYQQLLHRLIPLPARPGETLAELVDRTEQAAAKRRELEKATARLNKEPQFNRKVEMNGVVRRLVLELKRMEE